MGLDHARAGSGGGQVKRILWLLGLAVLAATPAGAQRNETADRAAIHALLVAYGTTLDSRDFDGFGKLFGTDGIYVAFGGKTAKGGPAAAGMMRQLFASMANPEREPNFHLFFNEVVTFEGPDRAHATSMSLWMINGPDKRPIPALAGRYDDELVRKDGHWLFARRTLVPVTNGPAK